MRFDVIASKILVRRDRIEPPRAPASTHRLGQALGLGFNSMQEVTLTDDADQPIVGIDDRNPPLIARSERSVASARTDVFGSTVITSVVITSMARIEYLPASLRGQ
jgi:hypothetical protein